MKERQVPDGRHAVIDDDFLDILFLTIPLYTIIHRAGAGDGQGAVTIQCPGQVIAADASYGEVGDEIAVGGGGVGFNSRMSGTSSPSILNREISTPAAFAICKNVAIPIFVLVLVA